MLSCSSSPAASTSPDLNPNAELENVKLITFFVVLQTRNSLVMAESEEGQCAWKRATLTPLLGDPDLKENG